MPDTRLGGGHPINFRPAGPLPEPEKCFWPFLPFLTPADESHGRAPWGDTDRGREEERNLSTSGLLPSWQILVYLTFELNSNILFISTRANRLVPNVSFEIYQQALQLNVRLSPWSSSLQSCNSKHFHPVATKVKNGNRQILPNHTLSKQSNPHQILSNQTSPHQTKPNLIKPHQTSSNLTKSH